MANAKNSQPLNLSKNEFASLAACILLKHQVHEDALSMHALSCDMIPHVSAQIFIYLFIFHACRKAEAVWSDAGKPSTGQVSNASFSPEKLQTAPSADAVSETPLLSGKTH